MKNTDNPNLKEELLNAGMLDPDAYIRSMTEKK